MAALAQKQSGFGPIADVTGVAKIPKFTLVADHAGFAEFRIQKRF